MLSLAVLPAGKHEKLDVTSDANQRPGNMPDLN